MWKNGRLTASPFFNIGAMQLLRVGNQRVSFEEKIGQRETERDRETAQPLQAPSSSDR